MFEQFNGYGGQFAGERASLSWCVKDGRFYGDALGRNIDNGCMTRTTLKNLMLELIKGENKAKVAVIDEEELIYRLAHWQPLGADGVTMWYFYSYIIRCVVGAEKAQPITLGSWGRIALPNKYGEGFLWIMHEDGLEVIKNEHVGYGYMANHNEAMKTNNEDSRLSKTAKELRKLYLERGYDKRGDTLELMDAVISMTGGNKGVLTEDEDGKVIDDYKPGLLIRDALNLLLTKHGDLADKEYISLMELRETLTKLHKGSAKIEEKYVYPICSRKLFSSSGDYIKVDIAFPITYSKQDVVNWVKNNSETLRDCIFDTAREKVKHFDAKFWELGAVTLSNSKRILAVLQLKKGIVEALKQEESSEK